MTSIDQDGDGIPEIIPRVEFDENGEPMIAREMVVSKSPIPGWLAILVAVLALGSVFYTYVEQQAREAQRKEQQKSDDEDDRRVEGLVEDLQVQQDRADRERARLRGLILGLLSAQSPEDAERLLREFTEDESDADLNDADEDQANPPGQPSTNDDGVTEQGAPPEDPPLGGPESQLQIALPLRPSLRLQLLRSLLR